MQSFTCTNCNSTTQTDAVLKDCPACKMPLAESKTEVAEATNQSVAGNTPPVTDTSAAAVAARDAANLQAEADLKARAAAAAKAQEAPVLTVADVQPTPAPAAPAPVPAPVESTGNKIVEGLAIGLADLSAVAKLIGDNFAGTPIAAIFKLLGPAAGIGAAVLAQHLQHKGFDLSTLKDADVL